MNGSRKSGSKIFKKRTTVIVTYMISHLESQSAVHHLITQLFHRKKRSISNAIEEEKERNGKKKKKKLGDQVRYFFCLLAECFYPNPILSFNMKSGSLIVLRLSAISIAGSLRLGASRGGGVFGTSRFTVRKVSARREPRLPAQRVEKDQT